MSHVVFLHQAAPNGQFCIRVRHANDLRGKVWNPNTAPDAYRGPSPTYHHCDCCLPQAPDETDTLSTNHMLRRKSSSARHGVAAVELAVCLPVLIVVSLVTIEVCSMLHLTQAMKVASFEAARVGVVPGAGADNVEFQCESLLDSRGVKAYTISMDPSDPRLLASGEYFRVSIEVNYDENAIMGSFLANGRVLDRSTALRVD